MDVSQVQSSIEAMNRLVKLVVSRNVQFATQMAVTNVQIQATGPTQEPQAVSPSPSGVGQLIDVLV